MQKLLRGARKNPANVKSAFSTVMMKNSVRLFTPRRLWPKHASNCLASPAWQLCRGGATRAGNPRQPGVATRTHSSKGRQFDVVIIPGLVEGIMPPLRWSPTERRYVEPNEKLLAQIRRLFYVGFTRARYCVHLIYSAGYRNNKGYPVSLGASRFAKEINARLAEAAGE
ncbi:MAG: ATP-dependent helicase UvrD/PcrA [Verrucomicrobiota bacterium]